MKTCDTCHVEKHEREFSKRCFEVYYPTCKRCVRAKGKQTKYAHPMAGYICEAYINNPNLTERQLAAIFNTTRLNVGRVLSAYFGDGTPVYMNITLDD